MTALDKLAAGGGDVDADVPSAPLANARTAGTLIRALAVAGVRQVVASPGGRNIPLLVAMECCPEIEVISVVDERQAGFVALGIARYSRRPVATVATSGSAAAHYLPAAVEADANGLPLVFISADRPEPLHGFGAPQCMPQTSLFQAYTRGSLALEAADSATDQRWLDGAVQDLVGRAVDGAGPVHINVPFRDPLWHEDAARQARSTPDASHRKVSRPPPRLASDDTTRLAQRLLRARRGLVVCGPSVGAGADSREVSSILSLARLLGWPVLADSASGVRFGGPSEGLVTTSEALLSEPSFARWAQPDVVLQFGREPVARAAWEWLKQLPESTQRYHIESQGRWFDPHLRGTEVLCTTAGEFFDALKPLLHGPSHRETEWLPAWGAADQAAGDALRSIADSAFGEAAVAKAVVESLAAEDVLLVGNSMPIRDVDLFGHPTGVCFAVHANRGVNGIDGHIATATGLALASRQRCVALIGDLTALHDLGALALLAQTQAPVSIVVADNGGGGIFEHLPVAKTRDRAWFEERVATSHQIDIAAVGRALGLVVHEVVNNKALQAALSPTGATRGPSLIVARVDRRTSKLNRRRALEAARGAVSELMGQRAGRGGRDE